jgi:DNA uptake protein ComE-like DNA-binding protein
MLNLFILTLTVAFAGTVFTGCSKNQSPQEIRQQTAQATADLKRDAKAVAQGVREGWNRDKPLNLNSATKDQLVDLPGVTAGDAERIVEGRPYDDPQQLVTRKIVSQAKYDKFADRVVAKR